MTSDATGSTHTQRRAAQKIKSTWIEHVKEGTRSLSDLAAASQQSGKEGDYLAQIRLVDLLSAVHPGLTRAQIIAELEPLPIKTPADPARFSVRSIRSRDELVAQVQSMLQTSAMTKNCLLYTSPSPRD